MTKTSELFAQILAKIRQDETKMPTQPDLGAVSTEIMPIEKKNCKSLSTKQASISKNTAVHIEEIPNELRLMIWDFAAENQQPQTIILRRKPRTTGPFFEYPDFTSIRTDLYQISYEVGVPAILVATPDSRHQALKCYEHCFAGVNGRPKYINWVKDSLRTHFEVIFSLDRIATFHNLASVLNDCNKVQNLILNTLPDYSWDEWPNIVSYYFEDLRVITVRQWTHGQADFEAEAHKFEEMWEKHVNPRRVAKGKLPNPTPTVIFERVDNPRPFHDY
jgi:2EXR family